MPCPKCGKDYIRVIHFGEQDHTGIAYMVVHIEEDVYDPLGRVHKRWTEKCFLTSPQHDKLPEHHPCPDTDKPKPISTEES